MIDPKSNFEYGNNKIQAKQSDNSEILIVTVNTTQYRITSQQVKGRQNIHLKKLQQFINTNKRLNFCNDKLLLNFKGEYSILIELDKKPTTINRILQPNYIKVDEKMNFKFDFRQFSKSKQGQKQKKSMSKQLEEISFQNLFRQRQKVKFINRHVLKVKQPREFPFSTLLMLVVWTRQMKNDQYFYQHRFGTAFLCTYTLLVTAGHNIYVGQNEEIINIYALSCTNGKAVIITIKQSFFLQQYKESRQKLQSIKQCNEVCKKIDRLKLEEQNQDNKASGSGEHSDEREMRIKCSQNDIAICQIQPQHRDYVIKQCGHLKLVFQQISKQMLLHLFGFPFDLILPQFPENDKVAIFGNSTKQYSTYEQIQNLQTYKIDTQSGVSGAPVFCYQNGEATVRLIHIYGGMYNQGNYGKCLVPRDSLIISYLIEANLVDDHGLSFTKEITQSQPCIQNYTKIDQQIIELFKKTTIFNQPDGLKCINKIENKSINNQIKISTKQGLKIGPKICLAHYEPLHLNFQLSDGLELTQSNICRELKESTVYLDKKYLIYKIISIQSAQQSPICLVLIDENRSQYYIQQEEKCIKQQEKVKEEQQNVDLLPTNSLPAEQLYFGVQKQYEKDNQAHYYILSVDEQISSTKSPQQLRVVQFRFVEIKILKYNHANHQLTYKIIVDEGSMLDDDLEEHGIFIFKEDKNKKMYVIGTIDSENKGKGKHFSKQEWHQWAKIIQKYNL